MILTIKIEAVPHSTRETGAPVHHGVGRHFSRAVQHPAQAVILLLGAGNTVKRKRRRNVCASTFGRCKDFGSHAANGSEEVLVEVGLFRGCVGLAAS